MGSSLRGGGGAYAGSVMAFGCMVESIAREEKGVKVLREFRSREDLFEARGVKGVPPDSTDDSLTESLWNPFDAAKKLFVDAKVGS